MLKFIRHHFSHILLIALWLGIVVTNYQWGTWLTGWDNLHPEINPLLDLSRGFNAVWQEYQGLGLLGGMAHAADFFRQIVVVLISVVLPQSLVRYVLLMTMLLLGTLGVRRLFEFIFARTQPVALVTAGANLAAMFYLLNIGTVQNFYVAFEPYYWFFGTLPWLLYFLMRAWNNGKPSSWALFLLVSFLASPTYYIQTNFVVYAALLTTIGGIYLLQTLRRQHPHTPLQALNNLSQTLVLILLANAFWILPQVYFVITGGSAVTMNSHINQVATPEVTVENEVFANPIDIMLLRGYWWNFTDYDYASDTYEYFMQSWLQHAPTMALGIVLAVACLAGAIYCWTDHRARSRVVAHQFGSFLPLAIVVASGTMVFLLLCHLFHLPLLSQIFRSPFTKVISSLSLLYSLLVGSSLFFIAQLMGNRVSVWIKKTRLVGGGLSIGLTVLMVCYSWPAFQGNFIYHQLHSRLPEAYFRLFDFMATQPEQARVALLPADTQYGWQFYAWGNYRGIGFYWFGLKQPILARAFDVWSKEDEDFHQELLWARHDTSPATLERVLAKYGVRYLLFDDAIILPRKQEHNYNDAWRALIQAAPSCKQVFNEASLTVYDCGEPRDGFVVAPESFYYTRRTNRQVFYDAATAAAPSGSVYLSTADAKVEQDLRSQVGTETFWPWAFLYQREIAPERLVITPQVSDRAQITLTADLHANLASSPVANQLVVPAHEAGTPLTLLVKPRLHGDHWQLVFTHPASLEVNQQAQAIYQDVIIDLPALTNISEDFYVDFGTSYTQFSSAAGTQEVFITLPHLNSDGRWTIFPVSAVTDETARGLVVEGGQAETLEVSKQVWTQYLQPQTIAMPVSMMDLKLRVITPMAVMRNDIFEEGVNCDSMKRGWTSKVDNEQQQDYWSLAFGASCDNFFHDSLDISRSSYLMTVTARNDIGLPFHYYIWDDDLHASAWENLFEEGESERVLSLVQMPKHQEGSTIDWHLANRSLMGEEARNGLVATPTIYGLDSRWLAQTQLTGDGEDEVSVMENELSVISQSKFGTSHYWVQVSHGGGLQPGLLVLEQGFHEAWRASINGKPLTHVRAKGWANGWLVPADLCEGECEVKITFWPQWLQWWGLVISVGAAIVGGIWWGLGRYRAWCDAKACVRPLPEIKFRQMRQQVREQFLGKDKVPVVWQEHQEEVSK